MPSQGGRLVALLSSLVREFSIEVVESRNDVNDVSETEASRKLCEYT